jgi:transposase InsO family protein
MPGQSGSSYRHFEDYNENHPHKALKMMSPHEYQQLAAQLETCPGK